MEAILELLIVEIIVIVAAAFETTTVKNHEDRKTKDAQKRSILPVSIKRVCISNARESASGK